MEGTINVVDHFVRVERETDDGEKSVSLSCYLCGKAFVEDADDSELITHLYATHADENGEVQQKRPGPLADDQIWKYYEKEADVERTSRCRECGKLVRHINGVACLRQHLRAHEEAYQKYLRERLDTDPRDLQMILDMPPKLARWYRKGQLTKYFEYVDTKEDRARCNMCGGSYQFKSTVANLKAHLKKLHPDQYRELRLSEGATVEDLDAETPDADTEKRPQRTIDLGDYFERYEDEEKSVTCTLCKKSFEEQTEAALVGHLVAEHPERVGARPSADAIWDFFEAAGGGESAARCSECGERGSFANGTAELAIHLSRAHPDLFEAYMERRLDLSPSDDDQSQRNRERAQRVRRRGKRSVLWEHFDAGDGRRALCRHCGNSISYKSTTGNLWLHLRASHPDHHALIDRDRDRRTDATRKLAKCSLCSKILSFSFSTSYLRKHLRMHGFGLQVELEADDGGEPREMKTCSVWEYFSRDDDEESVKCRICAERVHFEGESSLFDHLKDSHRDIQILEPDTDEETVRANKSNGSRMSLSELFTRHLDDESLKCSLCSAALPADDEAGLARHLREAHRVGDAAPDHPERPRHRRLAAERRGPGRRSRKNVVWQYFKVVDRTKMLARCSVCLNTFSFMTSVSNLKKHLIKKHDLKFDNADSIASCPVEKYFTKSPDDGSASCNLCEQPIEDGSEPSLLRHLRELHLAVAVEAEAHEDPEYERPSNGRSRLRSKSWKYFSIVDQRRSIARCSLCSAKLSYFGTISNLKKHLLNKHHLDPGQGRFPEDEPKYCSIWEYFTKSVDDESVKCNLCNEILLYESEQSLVEHMKAKHADMQIVDPETDAESDDAETKPKPKVLRAWRHFRITSSALKMAECKLCKMEVSYEHQDNILDHLKQNHSRKKFTSETDETKKYLVSASGALFEIEQEDASDEPLQEENAIFLEEYKEPRTGSKISGRKTRKRKRNTTQNDSDSESSEDNLNIYKNIKDAPTRDESLHHFGNYMVSLLRELPKHVSRKLQLHFIMQINEARTARRPATATDARHSSTE